MPESPWLIRLLPLLVVLGRLNAQLLVNPVQGVTHEVVVNPIQVENTAGQRAVFFGTPPQRAEIREDVNRIMAQVGVQVVWKTDKLWRSNFAFDNNGTDYRNRPRPDQLAQVVNQIPSTIRGSSTEVNLLFVKVSAALRDPGQYGFGGLAFVDQPNLMVAFGTRLMESRATRVKVSQTIAHELCHNLGLQHVNTAENLLLPGGSPGPTAARLSAQQKAIIFSDRPGSLDGFDLLRGATLVGQEPPKNEFERWTRAFAVTGGEQGDADGDGLSNLLEFVLNSDPTKVNSLPTLRRKNARAFDINFNRSRGAKADGLWYNIEVSQDLSSWVPAGAPNSRTFLTANNESVTVVELKGARQYLRASVQKRQNKRAAQSKAAFAFEPLPGDERLMGRCGCGQVHE